MRVHQILILLGSILSTIGFTIVFLQKTKMRKDLSFIKGKFLASDKDIETLNKYKVSKTSKTAIICLGLGIAMITVAVIIFYHS